MKFLSSRYLSMLLLAIYAILLASATWAEKAYGSSFAQDFIYFSPLFIALQAAIILNMLAIVYRGRYMQQRRWGMLLTHVAIAFIFVGALVTHIWGQEGTMHIREGQSQSTMVLKGENAGHIVHLPFSLTLRDFVLHRYHGSTSPSSYESHVTLHYQGKSEDVEIYMNHTLDVAAYRLFQLSFDPDEAGTYLLVNYDAWGRKITYFAYTLLGVGLLLSLLGRRGRVALLLARLSRLQGGKAACFLAFALALCSPTWAETEPRDVASMKAEALQYIEQYQIPQEQAARIGRLAMQESSGRLVPINTFASQLLRKFYRAESIGGMGPEQFLLSVWMMPHAWQYVPLISYKNPDITQEFNIPEGHLAMVDLFNEQGDYILQDELQAIYLKEANLRTLRDKELIKIDEKANLFNQILALELLRIFPNEADNTHRWYAPGDDLSAFPEGADTFVDKIFTWYLSELGQALGDQGDWSESQRVLGMIESYQSVIGKASGYDREKLDAEITYNAGHFNAHCKKIYLIAGGLLLILSFLRFTVKANFLRYIQWLLLLCVLGGLALQTYGVGLRWYIAGHAPWSSSYETMVYIAWVAVLIALLVYWRSAFVSSLAIILGGLILFVSGLQWMDPHITPLVPVLKSAWLMFHVAVIVAAYGFFGIAALIGFSNLVLMTIKGNKPHQRLELSLQELTIINEILLWFGLAFMAVGSYLGAVWANESWGRYWGWDPKETWALITIIVYLGVTHLGFLKRGYSLWLFNFASMMSILVVLMTYFGVNYFLSGMHAYSSTQLSTEILCIVGAAVALMLLLGLIARWRVR